MGPIEAIRTCLAKSFQFSGRATRPEFWWFVLFVFLLIVVASLVNVVVFGPIVTETVTEFSSHLTGKHTVGITTRATYGPGPFQDVVGLLMALPLFSAAWRRMNDAGNPGWIILTPIAASLALAVAIRFGPTETVDTSSLVAISGMDLPPIVTFPDPPTWLLVVGAIVILAGAILSILGLCTDSEPSTNRHGPILPEVTP